MKQLSKSRYTSFCQCGYAASRSPSSSYRSIEILRTRYLGYGESVGTFGTASAELNFLRSIGARASKLGGFKLCRAVTNEDIVKS